MLHLTDYRTFRQALADSQCRRCGLSQHRTHIVVDRGNPEAKVIFIGEAPGANEDLEGRAFVGRAGRLLDGMLKELGFDTDRDALIINVVKCRPPKNRPPLPEEVEACLPFLRKQVALVRPRLIALLGATALKRLLPEKRDLPMGEQAGKRFQHPDFPGAELMVLFHPAYILRDPRKKPLMREHLGQLVDCWKQI